MTEPSKVTRIHQGRAQQDDSWGTDDGSGYDKDKFYTRSVNKHDHSTNVQTPVPKDVAGRIDELVQKQVIPAYKSRQDVVRDAIIHRLQYLCVEQDVLNEAKQTLTTEMQMCMLQQKRERITTYKNMIMEAEELFRDMSVMGDTEGIKKEKVEVLEMAEAIPEPYRTRLMDAANRY